MTDLHLIEGHSEARREMAEYAAECFYTYEAMRDARDEALTRCQEFEAERDKARAWAALLFELVAAVEDTLATGEQAAVKVAQAQTLLSEASTLAGAR